MASFRPWGYQDFMFHPDVTKLAIGIVACYGFTGVFLALGSLKFNRRDL